MRYEPARPTKERVRRTHDSSLRSLVRVSYFPWDSASRNYDALYEEGLCKLCRYWVRDASFVNVHLELVYPLNERFVFC